MRRLIAENPWATIVSEHDGGLVASHYPILLDESAEELTILTHVGRPDEQVHDLGESEVLLIVAGPHGYISPSRYTAGRPAPTWNFSVAHCYGMPRSWSFGREPPRAHPPGRALRAARRRRPCSSTGRSASGSRTGTVGFRIPITRFVCKVKMSQARTTDPGAGARGAAGDRAVREPALADDMERALAEKKETGLPLTVQRGAWRAPFQQAVRQRGGSSSTSASTSSWAADISAISASMSSSG